MMDTMRSHPGTNPVAGATAGRVGGDAAATTDATRATPPLDRSFAQWVSDALKLARHSARPVRTLFDSGVPEPRALLRDTVSHLIEPDFGPHYASAFGVGSPVVLDLLARRYGVASDSIVCTTGASGALSLLFRSLCRQGDEVLVETPGFDLFEELARVQGLSVRTFGRPPPRYGIDPAAMEAAIRPATRMIVLSNLHNPSGMPINRTDLLALAQMAERRGIWVVVDEVYGDYVEGFEPACTLSPAVISVSSLTKFYGLSTLRCGWLVGSPDALGVVRDVASRQDFGLSNLAHGVAAEVLRDPAPYAAHSRDLLAHARPVIAAWTEAMIGEGLIDVILPEDGCIMFPRLIGIDATIAFADRLIADRGVIVAPGEYFGAPGHVRVGFGQEPAALASALDSLAEQLRAVRQAGPDSAQADTAA